MRDDERWLQQLVLRRRLEQLELQKPDAVGIEYFNLERLQRATQHSHILKIGLCVLRIVPSDSLGHREPRERLTEINGLVLVNERGRSADAHRDVAHQRLGQVHQIAIVRVRPVELEHRELGIVAR